MISLGAELKVLRRVNGELSQMVTDKNRDIESMRVQLNANIRMKEIMHSQLHAAEEKIRSLESQIRHMEMLLLSHGCYDK